MKKIIFYILLASVLVSVSYRVSFAALIGTIRQMETDLSGYVGKSVKITGEIDVSGHFPSFYKKKRDTHYAFRLVDGTGIAYVYVKKGEKRSKFLRDEILSTKNPVSGEFVIRMRENKLKRNYRGKIYAELRAAYFQDTIDTPKLRYMRAPKAKQIPKNKTVYIPSKRKGNSNGDLIVKMQEDKPLLLHERDLKGVSRTNQKKVGFDQKKYSEKISAWVDEEGKMHFTNAN